MLGMSVCVCVRFACVRFAMDPASPFLRFVSEITLRYNAACKEQADI